MPTLSAKPPKKNKATTEKEEVQLVSDYIDINDIIIEDAMKVLRRHAYGKSILNVVSTALSRQLNLKSPKDHLFEGIYYDLLAAYGDNLPEDFEDGVAKDFKEPIGNVNTIRRTVNYGNVIRYLPPSGHLSKAKIESMYYLPLKMWAKKNPYIKSEEERAKRVLQYKKKKIIPKPPIDYMSWIASSFRALVNNDFDAWIAVLGYEGTGKSAFALGLARYLGYYGFDFNPLTNVFFASTPVDYIIDMMENTTEQVFIFDEAAAFFDNRNAQKKDQKRLIQTMIMNRARRHVVILCIPDISGLDIKLRERRVSMIFQLLDRDHFAVLLKHTIGQTEDGFGYKTLNKSIKGAGSVSIHNLVKIMLNHPTCYGVFRTSGMLVSRATYNFYKKMKLELNKVSGGNNAAFLGPTDLALDFIGFVLKKHKDVLNEYTNKVGMDPNLFTALLKGVIPKRSIFRNDKALENFENMLNLTNSLPTKKTIEDSIQGEKGLLDDALEESFEEKEEEMEERETEKLIEEVDEDELEKAFEESQDTVADDIEEMEEDEANLPSL